ncbi:alpha/beta fold hydrolase, partial [Chloroflexota bacterium]
FTEPWNRADTIVLVHGIAENSKVWYAWVPHLAARYQIIRLDLRGWGKSTIPPDGYPWSTTNFARDIVTLLDKLKLQKVHLVGAKTGGTIALQFAHNYPERLHSLNVIGAPLSWKWRPQSQDHAKTVSEKGLKYWARSTMPNRLGDVPKEMTEWWVALFCQNSPQVVAEILAYFRTVDLTHLLPEIHVPTLVIIGESEALAPQKVFINWQQSLRDSELVIIPSKAYHLAATQPEQCTSAIISFLDKLQKGHIVY